MLKDVRGQVMDKEAKKEMKKFFSKIGKFFSELVKNRQALKQALDTGFDITAAALPYLDIAATIASGITPSKIDDAALAMIKSKYPRLFDGSVNTGDELKLYTLGAATELIKANHPGVSTTVARLAAQTAYVVKTKTEQVDDNKV